MAILVQRGKGNRDYQEVGPEYPLQVEVRQGPGLGDDVWTRRRYRKVYRVDINVAGGGSG